MAIYLLRAISTDECGVCLGSNVPDFVLHGGAACSTLERAKKLAQEWLESELSEHEDDDEPELTLEDTDPPSIEWDEWPETVEEGRRKHIRGWNPDIECIYSIEELEVID